MALDELHKFSRSLALSEEVTEEAARIYSRSLQHGISKGRPLAQVVAACLYTACRERKVPLTLDDLAAVTGVDRRGIAVCYRLLVRELKVKVPVACPAEYLAMVASRVTVSSVVQANALSILSKAEKAGAVNGRNPIGIAASALYIASIQNGGGLTQRDAADAAGVTDVTLRDECQRLKKAL